MSPKKAAWSLGKPTTSVDASGTASASVPLNDGKDLQGTLVFTMTADRSLRVEWRAEPGAVGLSGFQAWSNA